MKYQVIVQENREVTILEVTATHSRLAYESVLSTMGYAPWKFDTRMDLDASNTRRVVYRSKGLGDTLLEGIVKVIPEKQISEGETK